MAIPEAPRVVRHVRQRLGLSQEGLSRRLNATKGAIQHWERGRNQPDLARLFLLRSLCPAGPERKEVDLLIRHAQERVTRSPEEKVRTTRGRTAPGAGSQMLQRENTRLRQQLTKLQGSIDRRTEQLRILEDLATELQRQIAELKAERAKPKQPAASISQPNGE